eukprot:m.28031 g.28031  ORF g.28031 m.28031 type:complete len:86 (+) comp30535_c0_seq5:323-580(+)
MFALCEAFQSEAAADASADTCKFATSEAELKLKLRALVPVWYFQNPPSLCRISGKTNFSPLILDLGGWCASSSSLSPSQVVVILS